MLLSDIQIELLKYLIEFKQLTIPQMIQLTEKEYSYQKINRGLQNLLVRRKPLIARVEFKKINHFGKLSYVYNITKLGESKLYEQCNFQTETSIFAPVNPKLTVDYFHRTKTIDFHIHLHEYIKQTDYEILLCNHYFMVEKSDKHFVSINKITYQGNKNIIPDSIYSIGDNETQRFIFFELHNGKQKKRIIDQIENHAIVLTSLNAHNKYNIPKNKSYYILVVFEERSTMEGVISIIRETNRYRNIASFFLFKHILELEDDLFCNWHNLNGETVKIQI